MYIAISKKNEHDLIMVDHDFPLNHPVRSEYFIFQIDPNLNVDEAMQIARKRRKKLLDKHITQQPFYG